ncbi:MAG: endonuclease/exonuclease/phosphatase family protein [Chloroflexota bacterium]|nr:MAG: endonuclease [Chloroflexota bacterium]
MTNLRIMTFNIRGSRFDDGENIWPNRARLNVATILKHAPDLIGFQEFDLGNLAFYRDHLPGYEHILGPGYNDEEPYQYPAIFWRPERLRLVESGGFWLSETPEVHSRSWDTACIRSAAWARFELPGGARLLHLNTHLDHVSELARVEGARLIARRLAELWADGGPAVVTGDFNCIPGSDAYQALVAAGLSDAYLAAHPGADPVMTFHGFKGVAYRLKEHDMPGRIDWILVRGLQVSASEIVTDAEPPYYPSDHYPVTADCVL